MDLFTNQPAPSATALEIPSIPGGKPNTNHPRKTRSACNRCHAQKLKCVRETVQSSSCERCLRMKTICRFGPRAARVSQKPSEQIIAKNGWHDPVSLPATTPMPIGPWDTTDADMSEIELISSVAVRRDTNGGQSTLADPCYSMPNSLGGTQELCWSPFLGISRSANSESSADLNLTAINDNFDSVNSLPSPGSLDFRIDNQCTMDIVDLAPPSTVAKIARLEVELYECGLKLPSSVETGSIKIATRKAKLFALDELFHLTTDFLDILNSLSHEQSEDILTSSLMNPMQPRARSNFPQVTNSQPPSPPTQRAGMKTRETSGSISYVDQATRFMIISCHCRLTEIYTSLFQMMQACIEHSLAPRKGNDWAIILPELQVGSIASPPVHVDINTPVSPSTSSMYMLIITMLSSQLWERLADAMGVGDCITLGTDSRSLLTDAVWNAVMDKNSHMSQTIENTRLLLQRYSAVRA